MVISTKYAIGEEVYAVYKQDDLVHIFKDRVSQIVIISEKEQLYYLEKHNCDEYKESELVKTTSTTELIEKIEKLTGGIE